MKLYNLKNEIENFEKKNMNYIKFSIFLNFSVILIFSIVQLILSYDLFIISNQYSFLFENSKVISVYHKNNTNSYFFIFSTFLIFIIFTTTSVYYMYTYFLIFLEFLFKKKQQRFYKIVFEDEFYVLNEWDFVFLAINVSFNIVLAIHLFLEIIQKETLDEAKNYLYILLSTQIILISLRYPLLFQQIDEHISLNSKKTDAFINSLKIDEEEEEEDEDEEDEKIELKNFFNT
jgi:hypothetical protein